jgi:hypothetical protein
MKSQKYSLQIPEPCEQDWDKMSPEGNGRYCQQCTKVVVDFSKLTDDQIISYLQSQKKEVCGRVRMTESQLNREYIFVHQNTSPFRNVVFRYSIAGLLTFATLKGAAQKNINPTTLEVQKDNTGKIQQGLDVGKSNHKEKINLRVQDQFTGKSLEQSYLKIGVTGEIIKPVNGSLFAYEIPDSLKNKTLAIYFYCPGYETEVFMLNDLMKQGDKTQIINMVKYEKSMKMGKMMYVPQDTSKKKCSK